MRQLPILSAVFVTAATPLFAQVTVDLHALQALPERPSVVRPTRPSPPYAPPVAAREAVPSTSSQSATPPKPTTPGQPEILARPDAPKSDTPRVETPKPETPAKSATLAQPETPALPAIPQTVPDTAMITPIAPPPPASGALPPPPPVSDKAATAAAPMPAGLRLTFAPGQSDLSPESVTSIKQLAQAATPGDATTFNVSAYAPGKPDDPSTARRMSLSRAMAVRNALVADGVASARIFVRALGEQHGDGPPDRVDVSITGANAPETATTR